MITLVRTSQITETSKTILIANGLPGLLFVFLSQPTNAVIACQTVGYNAHRDQHFTCKGNRLIILITNLAVLRPFFFFYFFSKSQQ